MKMPLFLLLMCLVACHQDRDAFDALTAAQIAAESQAEGLDPAIASDRFSTVVKDADAFLGKYPSSDYAEQVRRLRDLATTKRERYATLDTLKQIEKRVANWKGKRASEQPSTHVKAVEEMRAEMRILATRHPEFVGAQVAAIEADIQKELQDLSAEEAAYQSLQSSWDLELGGTSTIAINERLAASFMSQHPDGYYAVEVGRKRDWWNAYRPFYEAKEGQVPDGTISGVRSNLTRWELAVQSIPEGHQSFGWAKEQLLFWNQRSSVIEAEVQSRAEREMTQIPENVCRYVFQKKHDICYSSSQVSCSVLSFDAPGSSATATRILLSAVATGPGGFLCNSRYRVAFDATVSVSVNPDSGAVSNSVLSLNVTSDYAN